MTTRQQHLESFICHPKPQPKKQKCEAPPPAKPRDPALQPFTARFLPVADSDLLDPAVKDAVETFVRRFARQLEDDDSDRETCQALLLLGRSGSGKTTSVRYVARTLDMRLVEVTTADLRDSASLRKRLGEATQTHNVLKNALLFVDDIDVVSEQDKGFYRALHDLMGSSKVPLVMAAAKVPEELLGRECVEIYEMKVDSAAVLRRVAHVNESAGLSVSLLSQQALCQLYQWNLAAVLNALQLRDLSLASDLRQEAELRSDDSGVVAISPNGNWTTLAHEGSFVQWLYFLHANVETLNTQNLEVVSRLEDLMSALDQLGARLSREDSTAAVRCDVLTLDNWLQARCASEHLVLQERRPEACGPEFQVATQASPYHTRSRTRNPQSLS